jgi:hypothetical protein
VEGKKERIALGQAAPSGGVFVKRGDEPALLTFPASLADQLEPTGKRFQPLEPWAAHQPSEVTSLEVRDGTSRRSLVLADSVWKAPGGKAISDADAVRELVRRLIKLRVLGFVRDEPRPEHGLATPSAEVQLKLAGGSVLSLALGAPTDGGAYARVGNAGVYEVGNEVVAQLKALAGTGAMPSEAPAEGEEDEEAGEDPLDEHGHDDHMH